MLISSGIVRPLQGPDECVPRVSNRSKAEATPNKAQNVCGGPLRG
jgi:hypothetical protein